MAKKFHFERQMKIVVSEEKKGRETKSSLHGTKMKDYTSNYYCDFLWISDLLEAKKNAKNRYEAKLKKNNSTVAVISFANVAIFGTIVQIKQVDQKKYLYYVDDGTGVIACKHSEDQFDEAISTIEREQESVLNQTVKFGQSSFMDHSSLTDSTLDDSIFNDKSIQDDEQLIMKKNLLMGIQSIWNDVYDSFTNLLALYKIGDTVHIEGKLYSYFNNNQIYINNIRLLEMAEEIIKTSVKLKDGYDPLTKNLLDRKILQAKRRCSGLMTFDNVHHLSIKIPPQRPMGLQKDSPNLPLSDSLPEIIPPHIEPTMTFDTFNN